MTFKFLFQLSEFSHNGVTYKLDYYETTTGNIQWKKGVQHDLPEFDVDYKHACIKAIAEYEPFKTNYGWNSNAYYYPGFKLQLFMIRNPYSNLQKHILPSILIGMYCLTIYSV